MLILYVSPFTLAQHDQRSQSRTTGCSPPSLRLGGAAADWLLPCCILQLLYRFLCIRLMYCSLLPCCGMLLYLRVKAQKD